MSVHRQRKAECKQEKRDKDRCSVRSFLRYANVFLIEEENEREGGEEEKSRVLVSGQQQAK